MLSQNIYFHGYTCAMHNINEVMEYVCVAARNPGRSGIRDEYERSKALDRPGLYFEMGARSEAL